MDHPKEVDLGGLYVAFLRVEDQSVLPGYLHQPMEIEIVFLCVFAVDKIFRNVDGAWALTEAVIHGLLEGVLGHAQTKGESELSNWAVERCQLSVSTIPYQVALTSIHALRPAC